MPDKNELPEGWVVRKLGEVCEINPKIPNKLAISDELEIQFLPMKLVEEETGRTYLSETRKYGDVKKGYTAFVDHDVIFAKVTPCMENGKIAIVENLKNGIGFGSSEFHVLRTTNGIIPHYVFHFLVQKRTRSEAENSMTGAVGLRRVPKQFLENYPIPLPPLPVQHAIVAKIEAIFSELDHGVEQLKTAQAQLKVYRQAVLKWAFEGKLTGAAVPDGELPEGWKWVRLGEVIQEIEAGKSIKCDERPPRENEVGIVKVSAVTWGFFDEMESKTCYSKDAYNPNYLIREGDFLFSRANTLELVGACVIVHKVTKKLMLSDKILRFQFCDGISKPFVLHYLRSRKGRHEIEHKSSGNQMSMRNIGQGKIKEIEIPLPPLPVQHLIVAEIERRLSGCAALEAAIERSLREAEVLRQGVLKRAFEGRLVA